MHESWKELRVRKLSVCVGHCAEATMSLLLLPRTYQLNDYTNIINFFDGFLSTVPTFWGKQQNNMGQDDVQCVIIMKN